MRATNMLLRQVLRFVIGLLLSDNNQPEIFLTNLLRGSDIGQSSFLVC